MNAISLIVISCLGHAVAQSEMTQTELDQRIETTFFSANSRRSDLTWITDENRPLVVKLIHNRPDDPYGPYIKGALARAGHWETILSLVQDINDPLKDISPLMYADEKIIPYLMPIVYNGSTENPNIKYPGDVILRPAKATAIGCVLGIISKSERFPPKTRKWADALSRNGNKYRNEEWVALITSWWEQNRKAIEEERYKDATWVPTYKGRPITDTPKESRLVTDYLEQEHAKRLAKRDGVPDETDTILKKPDDSSTAPIWVSIGAIVSAACFHLWRKIGKPKQT